MRPGYNHYLLVVLLTILAFNTVDRVALGLVLQDIKADLHLTDTQLGFLSGISFALFYAVMGIPIARWADRGNRVAIISITTGLWSLMVSLCGVTGTFSQLMLVRVGVAVGEAGCTPPAFSLIADYYHRAQRPRAIAIYGLGVPLGTIIAFVWAGWLNEMYGWRVTFVLLGVPGVLLAAVARVTLREPRKSRGQVTSVRQDGTTIAAPGQPSLATVSATLWTNMTFRHLLLYVSVQAFFAYGILAWLPAFFVRSYGMGTGTIGTWLAFTYGMGGLIGSCLGGELASRYAACNERGQLRAIAFAAAISGMLSMLAYLSHHPHLAFGLIGLSILGLTLGNGPVYGTLQTLVPQEMRAMSIAVIYLCANFIGMGLGPLITGSLSDFVGRWAGQESLRYTLLTLAAGYFWVGWHGLRASQTVRLDLARALSRHNATSEGCMAVPHEAECTNIAERRARA
jgi:MFS family permease